MINSIIFCFLIVKFQINFYCIKIDMIATGHYIEDIELLGVFFGKNLLRIMARLRDRLEIPHQPYSRWR